MTQKVNLFSSSVCVETMQLGCVNSLNVTFNFLFGAILKLMFTFFFSLSQWKPRCRYGWYCYQELSWRRSKQQRCVGWTHETQSALFQSVWAVMHELHLILLRRCVKTRVRSGNKRYIHIGLQRSPDTYLTVRCNMLQKTGVCFMYISHLLFYKSELILIFSRISCYK